MNSFYTALQEALNQGKDIVMATAVDCLVEFSDSYDTLVAQKAFRVQDELTVETASMRPFWQSVFTAMPEQLPGLFSQDTWWAYFDALDTPFPAGTLEKLASGESLVMATVIAKADSSFAAAKAAVDKNGTLYGSLGDSALDAEVVKTALSVLDEGAPRLLEYTMDSSDELSSTLRILLDPIF